MGTLMKMESDQMARSKSVAELAELAHEDDAAQDTAQADVFAQDNGFSLFDGIPIPDTTRTRASKYPWDEMATGQSFFVPGAKLESFSTAVSSRNRKGEKKYIVRKYTGPNGVAGVMVWRKS
jgi:hypothetical protein